MEFKFDPNQTFQLQAITAVADLFDGQPKLGMDMSFSDMGGFAAVPNRLDLAESQLLENLNKIQESNLGKKDDKLEFLEGTAETERGATPVKFGNFSVEMETGTGKTYVYYRTILELYQHYGFKKFIVVVPSVAIREGVLKTYKITKKHFEDIYGNLPYRVSEYRSERIQLVRQFALSENVEILVMTIDSFNKASNVIKGSTDKLQGDTPLHLLQATKPILILDEPQNMESELSIAALATLCPLFALRYSATHRNPYNLVYRLTPYDAYKQGLVKKIEVASVVKEGEVGPVFVKLEDIKAQKSKLTAKVAIHQLMKTGVLKEKVITVKPEDSLEALSGGRPEYHGFEVDEINLAGGFVRFANNVELKLGESRGTDKDAIFEAQIRYTIEEHFRKQAKYKAAGIKVLSLFFIDRVDNYVNDGMIRKHFDKAFNELKVQYPDWKDKDPAKVQTSYFAQKRHRGGVSELIDTTNGKSGEDESAYNLIMKDKERLLSFEREEAFIFSHSALREGWDNPNVFQICTLNQTVSEVKKRQEVGRGVRLCVNQAGDRLQEGQTNVLTVVANESYEEYVRKLQEETETEYGKEGVPPKPPNARKRETVRLRKEYLLKPEFKELWKKISQKTRYSIKIDSQKLVLDVVAELDHAKFEKPRVEITKVQVQVNSEEAFKALQMSAARSVIDLSGRYPLPNLIEIMGTLMENTTPPLKLSRKTLLEIMKTTKNSQAAADNPQEFATIAAQSIKGKLAAQLIDGIKYEKLNDWYEMTQFALEFESWENHIEPSRKVDGTDGTAIYDQVVYDSEVEQEFVKGLEQRDDVKLYIKLPDWFEVDTPIGKYNPDWAIVMESRDEHGQVTDKSKLYLVRETKSTKNTGKLRPDEERKIECGKRHFGDALGVDYRVVTNAKELP
jgi:type III restriction enzyme